MTFNNETESNTISELKSLERHNSRSTIFVAMAVVLFLFSATALAVTILYFTSNRVKDKSGASFSEIPEVTYTREEVDRMIEDAVEMATEETEAKTIDKMIHTFRNASEEPSGVLLLLRQYYPNSVVFQESSRFEYYPIYSTLKPNTIDIENLVYDEGSGKMYYMEDGETVSSIAGVDVSSFQKDIDWVAVKNSGIEFAMIRCGFRGYGTGAIKEDTYFKQNIEGALEAGLKVGVYFYTQAINIEEAIEEAEFTLEMIAPYKIDYPVVIDIEEVNDTARTDDLDNTARSEIVRAFCDRVSEEGYTPMLYSNLKYLIKNLDLQVLDDIEKWFAYYNTTMYYPYKISMWQYSCSGVVDGIPGEVDINIGFKDWGK